MSVTFLARDAPETEEEDFCLCAQMAPCIGNVIINEITDEQRAQLREYADPNCRSCKGTGVGIEMVPEKFVNFSNTNARGILGVLGIPVKYGISGRIDLENIPAYRRRIIHALNVESDRAPLLRDPSCSFRPGQCTVVTAGADDDSNRGRLQRLLDLFEYAADWESPIVWY